MKKLLILFGTCLVGFSACTEKAPDIILHSVPAKVDTFYISSANLTPEPHNVLVEDFTGATCTNCPAAHDIIKGLQDIAANRGRIIDIALHINDYPQTEPVRGHKYDFRSAVATSIQNGVFQSLIAMPIGGIDRQPNGSNTAAPLQCSPTVWASTINSRLNTVDSINLDVVSSYDPVAKKVKITATVSHIYATDIVQNLNLAIVEDSFIDKQEDNRVTGYTDTAYHFNSILRALVTATPLGDQIAPSYTNNTKPKGLVYTRYYTYDWNTAWNPANCRVIAFVTKGAAAGAANVYQTKEAKIAP